MIAYIQLAPEAQSASEDVDCSHRLVGAEFQYAIFIKLNPMISNRWMCLATSYPGGYGAVTPSGICLIRICNTPLGVLLYMGMQVRHGRVA